MKKPFLIPIIAVLLIPIAAKAETAKLYPVDDNFVSVGRSYISPYQWIEVLACDSSLGCEQYIERSYIKLNLSSIPENAVVNSAKLYLYLATYHCVDTSGNLNCGPLTSKMWRFTTFQTIAGVNILSTERICQDMLWNL